MKKNYLQCFLFIKGVSSSGNGIPLAEHVPDLTAKDDIAIVKEYLKQHYPEVLDWKYFAQRNR